MATIIETTEAPASGNTPYSLLPGDEFQGQIGSVGDQDVIALSLNAGETYDISLISTGTTPFNSGLIFMNGPLGGAIPFYSLTSLASTGYTTSFTAPVSGTYYFTVKGYTPTAEYTLSVSAPPPPPTGPTAGDDSLTGTAGVDIVDLLAGDDWFDALDGNDKILAGDGHDTVFAGLGNDTVFGGNGDDLIWGHKGNDNLRGNAGNDTMHGGDGDDLVRGDAGDDEIHGNKGNDDLRGNTGNDDLHGAKGNDLIYGEEGDDNLWGALGNDTLDGGAGNDWLHGSFNDDVMTGGADADVFEYRLGDGFDTITDFEDGIDMIEGSRLSSGLKSHLATATIVIADGSQAVIADGPGALTIENNSGSVITLTADDFIF